MSNGSVLALNENEVRPIFARTIPCLIDPLPLTVTFGEHCGPPSSELVVDAMAFTPITQALAFGIFRTQGTHSTTFLHFVKVLVILAGFCSFHQFEHGTITLISGSELKVGSTGLVRLVAIFNFIFPVILRLLLGGRGQFLGVKEEIFADIPILLGRQNFSVEFHG